MLAFAPQTSDLRSGSVKSTPVTGHEPGPFFSGSRAAGPWRTSPSTEKRDPWQGQSQLVLAGFYEDDAPQVRATRRDGVHLALRVLVDDPPVAGRDVLGVLPRPLYAILDEVRGLPRLSLSVPFLAREATRVVGAG